MQVDRRGKHKSNYKLTENDVLDIRCYYIEGIFNQKQLSTKYKVSQSCISNIVNNKRRLL